MFLAVSSVVSAHGIIFKKKGRGEERKKMDVHVHLHVKEVEEGKSFFFL